MTVKVFLLEVSTAITIVATKHKPQVVHTMGEDFPGMCFASTRCATIEPTKTWELSPFCGRSTCVPADDNSGRLFELVEDCGPLPKANPKCKLSDKTNKTASFPDCCPIFECEDGAKLEYPEIPTLAPPTEILEVEKTAETTTAKA
ncbi:PREDICTED: uncharacterized protein LOC106789548 isoform X2 [Polistes canadensis]|uniref:uncharacterized protein LOC106789548 isoform X2 n=1 Tax=Polistes canadensis TaxID=91411 RepID=UPI000718AFCB|nr:PREDICTED: uncharacterized protein LOC106789548 isoform X2 [Polistes canadensis]